MLLHHLRQQIVILKQNVARAERTQQRSDAKHKRELFQQKLEKDQAVERVENYTAVYRQNSVLFR